MKYYISLFFLIFISPLYNAQIIRKYSNDFLNIGAGARGLAMGGAVVSHQNDVYAPMWNPAGLAEISSDWQGAAMHAEYFESIAKYDYLSYGKALDNGKGALGISIIRLGIDNILNTTKLIDSEGNIDYDKITKFSQADYAGIITYAFKPHHQWNVGVNTKIIYRNVGKFANAFGFGFDIGATYHSDKGWVYAAMLRDATTTVNFWSINQKELSTVVNGIELNPTPKNKMELSLPKLNLGVSKKFELNRDFNLLPEIGANMEFMKTEALLSTDIISLTPYAGAELSYQDIVFIRAGINRFQNITNVESPKRQISFQPSAGIGIKYKGVSLDYAITNSGIGGSHLYSNFFSLKLDMGAFRN